MRIITSTVALLAFAGCIGCESNAPTSVTTQAIQSAAPPPPQPAATAANAAPDQAAPPVAQQPVVADAAADPVARPAAATPPAPDAPADPATVGDPANREKAQVGVGKRGRDYAPGFITTPIAAYFRTGDRIAFEVQIPNSMKIYKAAHNNKGPKTHQEFFDVIIKENAVQLPDLPTGDSYIYDPKTEELMVQHPKDD